MDNIINSLVPKTVGVTDQQIKDYLTSNPNLGDAQIAKAMETYGVSPSQMARAVGISEGEVAARVAATVPPGQAMLLGDTWVQPNYRITGSGEDQQIGPIEGVSVYKTKGGINDQLPVGTAIQNYAPTGEFLGTGKTQKTESGLGEFLLGSAALFGGLGGGFESLFGGGAGTAAAADAAGGLLPAYGTDAAYAAGLGGGNTTLGTLGALGTDAALGTGVTGMGAGTGITAGSSGLGLNAGTAGLGAEGLGAGITAGSGLTGTGVLTGSELGTGLLGSSALNNLTGTGVLTGSTLGTGLLGTGTGTGLTGTGVLTGSTLGTGLLGTGAGSGITGGVTGLGGTGLGTGALTTGVGSGGGTGGVVGAGTGLLTGTGTGTGVVGGTGTGVGTGVGTGLGTALGTSLGTGLGLSALGSGLGAYANQQGITDARNLINQYGTQAGSALAGAYQNAQNLGIANRADLANIYANTGTNMQNLYNQQVGYQQPYQSIGNQGASGLGANADYFNRQFTNADLNANLAPNYAFQLQQGQMANQRAANMGGGALSGNALQGLQRYTQDYAGGAYQNAFNNFNTQRQNIYSNLSDMAKIGGTSAGQLANLGANYGSNLGSLGTGYGSNLTTGYGQGINAANQFGLNTAGLATGIGGALASNATQSGANTASLLSNLGNTALLGSMLKAT